MAGTSQIANAIDQCMQDIRRKRSEAVSLEDISGVVSDILSSLSGDLNAFDQEIFGEVQELVAYIRSARQEIADLQPQQITNLHIPVATDELGAVVSATEQAASAYLDIAEKLEILAGEVEDDEQGGKLINLATQIYEASSFQDITGQRITKVVSTLRHIETKLIELMQVTGTEGEDMPALPAAAAAAAGNDGDTDLLNGPSMPDSANSQDDIDALLASFD